MGARLVGLAVLAAGVAFAWLFGLRPLQEAFAAGDPDLFVGRPRRLSIFVGAPLMIVGGLFLLVGGRAVAVAFSGPPRGRQQHLIVWSAFALAIAVGGAAFWRYEAERSALVAAARPPVTPFVYEPPPAVPRR